MADTACGDVFMLGLPSPSSVARGAAARQESCSVPLHVKINHLARKDRARVLHKNTMTDVLTVESSCLNFPTKQLRSPRSREMAAVCPRSYCTYFCIIRRSNNYGRGWITKCCSGPVFFLPCDILGCRRWPGLRLQFSNLHARPPVPPKL
jgi:hypothetical protein